MLKAEQALMWQAHPRTKGSTGYPDAVREMEHFRSDRFLGASYQSLPVDQSEKRICEKRCFGVLDDMNNWAGPKYLIAEGDTYMKYPDDETYGQLTVNYVKLDRVPKFDEDWTPLLRAMRAGDFLRVERRSPVAQLRHRGHRRAPHIQRGSGVDIPAGVRRAGVGRRRQNRPADRFGDGDRAVQQPQISHSVRRRGEEMGALRGVGLGGQRSVHAAGAFEIDRTLLNMFSLTGKTALVAGASRGIGLAIAQQMAAAGAHTILAARSQ